MFLLPIISVSEKHSRPRCHGPPRGGHLYLRDSRAGQRRPWVAAVSEGRGPCMHGHPRASHRPVVATCKDPTAEPRGAGEGPGCREGSGACSRGRRGSRGTPVGGDRPQHSVHCKCQRTAPVGAWDVPRQMTRPRRARWRAKVIDSPHFLPVGRGERQEGGGKSV